ncbi:MAG: phosphonate C-P lyase system protein PhnH [Ktedonobacteraceae bacterium]|nr:phosphonate C-P lyase system protein PhnH [Ktedonobacteraceae bacterium]
MALTSFRQAHEERIHYSAVTFRRLLNSLACPGTLNQLTYPTFLGEPPVYYADSGSVPLNLYALGAFSTLLDGETSFMLVANGRCFEQDALPVQWLTLRSGARGAAPEAADFVFFSDGKSGGLLPELRMGTFLEPESSATVFYCVEHLVEARSARDSISMSSQPVSLRLSGPGIQEQRTVNVAGLAREEIGLIQGSRKSYPQGIDIYLVDSAGLCLGLPRTTRIHVEHTEGR